MLNSEKSHLLIVLLFLALSFFSIFQLRQGYFLPIHSDEYDHLAIVQETIEKQKIIHYDPYTVFESPSPNIEMGYDLLLVSIAYLAGIELVLLPAISSIFMTFLILLSVFVLVRHFAKSDLAGLFSALFILFLPNSVVLLAQWFMVPTSFGLAMIAILFYCFARGLQSKKFALLLPVFALQTILVHPPSVAVLIPIFAIYLILTPKEIKKHLIGIIALAAGLFATAIFFLYLKGNFGIKNIVPRILSEITFKREGYETIVSIQEYLTPLILFFTLIGILYLLKPMVLVWWNLFKKIVLKNENSSTEGFNAEHYSKILIISFIAMLAMKTFADLTDTVFLTLYPRLVIALCFILLIIGGMGLYAVFRLIQKTSADLGVFSKKAVNCAFALLIVILFLFGFSTIPYIHSKDLYKNVLEKELPAILWIKENSNNSDIIIGIPGKLKGVHFFAERKVAGTNPTRLGNEDYFKKIEEYVFKPCEFRQKLLEENSKLEHQIFFDTQDSKTGCKFYDKMYSQGKSLNIYFKNDFNSID